MRLVVPDHLPPLRRGLGRQSVEQALPVLQDHRVEKHQPAQAVGHPVGHAADDDPGEAVADQDDLAQLLGLDHIGDVGHEGVEREREREQMAAVAETGLGGREHAMPHGPQAIGDAHLAPTAMPVAVDENEGGGCYQRSAAVCTGASQRPRSSSSRAVTVSEQPAMSREVQ